MVQVEGDHCVVHSVRPATHTLVMVAAHGHQQRGQAAVLPCDKYNITTIAGSCRLDCGTCDRFRLVL